MDEKKNGDVPKLEPEEDVTKETKYKKADGKSMTLAKVLGAVATVLTAATGVVVAVWEPTASQAKEDVSKSYEETAKAVNKLKEAVKQIGTTQDKLTKRIIFFQAWQEGSNAGKLQAEVDRLQSENTDLRGKKATRNELAAKLAALQDKFEKDQNRREKMKRRKKDLLKGMGGGSHAVQKLAPMPTNIKSIPDRRRK